uniref:hypothetical protein n=1 Tax=Flavobacterium sp. TaxID=239 RepID=UPI00404A3413
MTDEELTRKQIIDIVNDEPVNDEPVNDEALKEEIKEEIVKPKPKRASRAKPKQIKIIKESVEPVEPVEPIVKESVEPVEPVVEPVIEEQPKKVDKLKQIVECPDCHMKLTVHTLKYIHKRRGFCKAVKPEVVPVSVPESVQQKPKPIADETVNDYIKQNPDIVTNYLRNERLLKAQKKQSHARNLLNNAF